MKNCLIKTRNKNVFRLTISAVLCVVSFSYGHALAQNEVRVSNIGTNFGIQADATFSKIRIDNFLRISLVGGTLFTKYGHVEPCYIRMDISQPVSGSWQAVSVSIPYPYDSEIKLGSPVALPTGLTFDIPITPNVDFDKAWLTMSILTKTDGNCLGFVYARSSSGSLKN